MRDDTVGRGCGVAFALQSESTHPPEVFSDGRAIRAPALARHGESKA
jgi:hypothetical protein